MVRHNTDWDVMFSALESFKAEQGHCHVPTHWKKNPQLGQWVALQRYRHKIGELQEQYVDRLNKIGFVWAPADRVWNKMFQKLVAYRNKHGNCAVPTSYPSDPPLSRWVVTQRRGKKTEILSEERLQKLEGIGFVWSVRERGKVVPEPVKAVGPEEHLYLVSGEYIQYGGTGPRPAKLEKYVQFQGGELPPSIILPCKPTVFRIGNTDSAYVPVQKIKWSGKGPIPEDVLEYLNENGVLPPHS